MKKFVLRELGFIAVAWLLAAASAESYLRHYRPQNLQSPAYEERFGMRVFRANSAVKHRNPAFDVVYHINSLGFRGREVTFHKKPGTFRIITLGPSFSFGIGVNDEQTYSAVLEKKLNTAVVGRSVEVVNLGMGSGMGFFEFLFRKLGAQFEPDMVIVYLFFASPQALASEQLFVQEGLLNRGMKVLVAQRLARWLPGYAFFCENSHLWALKRLTIATDMARDTAAQTPTPDQTEERLQATYIARLAALADTARQRHATTLVFMTRHALEPFPRIQDYVRRRSRRDAYFSVLEIDVPPGDYYPVEGHWNPRGHEAVADQLFRFIRPRLSGAG